MLLKIATTFLACVPVLAADAPKLRLPETSRPIRYDVSLSLDPSKSEYSGRVGIDIEILKPTRELWLNAEGLTLRKAWLKQEGDLTIQPQPHDFAGFTSAIELRPGRARLTVEFDGKFEDKNSNGLFRMKEGEDWYLFTQFEPIAARAAFPCYDEPGYKVPWALTLTVPHGLKAVANTPQSGGAASAGKTVIRFAESKPMPSYLVAFAVGPFEFVDAGHAGINRTPLRIVTPKGAAEEARYAVEITGKVMEELEAYFGRPYPYEKLDSIAIPLTFGFGAMENAGLITYARTLLLSPPSRESDSFRQSYLSVAAHEIAHQWFGNLVTPEYWDDIWLNEAFATWLEAKITARMRPQWNREISEIESRTGAMSQDSLATTRRIRQPIENNGDIVNAFDGITYEKGAAVIGMFESYVGEGAFRDGVRRYMKQYEWRNATAGMFLDSISTPQTKSVSAAFSTFLNQPGVPLLSVKLNCGGALPALSIRQQRLLPLGSKGSVQQSWQVPVCVSYAKDGQTVKECKLITSATEDFVLDTKSCPAWINANAGAEGYYRVAYEPGMVGKLAASGSLSKAETVDLLDSTVSLVNAGLMPVADAVAVARRYAADQDWNVASRSLNAFVSLSRVLQAEDQPAFARQIRETFGSRARALGWKPRDAEDEDTRRERRELLPAAASMGEDPELSTQALDLARLWLKKRDSLPRDLAGPVVGIAAKAGGKAFHDELKGALKTTTDRSERGILISGLAGSNDPELTMQAMRMITSREIDFREAMPMFFVPLGNDRTREVPYQFVTQNYDALMAVAPAGGSFNFGSALPMVSTGMCSVEQGEQARSFFSSKLANVTGAERAIHNAVERIDLCSARKSALQPQIHEVLQAR